MPQICIWEGIPQIFCFILLSDLYEIMTDSFCCAKGKQHLSPMFLHQTIIPVYELQLSLTAADIQSHSL